MIRGSRFGAFVNTMEMMLILCPRSVAHGLSPMDPLQVSAQQRYTPGLNDNSPSHRLSQIHSLDMVRRSMLPRPRKETYI